MKPATVAHGARCYVKDGRWYATAALGSDVWRVGYCAGQLEFCRTGGNGYDICPDHMRAPERLRDRFHRYGHASAQEAEECFIEYLVDFCTKFDGRVAPPSPCLVCGTPTSDAASLPLRMLPLCDLHRTAENVTSILRDRAAIKT